MVPAETAHLLAWQVQLGAPDAASLAVQHLESWGAACSQRSPRDRALLRGRCSTLCESLGAACSLQLLRVLHLPRKNVRGPASDR